MGRSEFTHIHHFSLSLSKADPCWHRDHQPVQTLFLIWSKMMLLGHYSSDRIILVTCTLNTCLQLQENLAVKAYTAYLACIACKHLHACTIAQHWHHLFVIAYCFTLMRMLTACSKSSCMCFYSCRCGSLQETSRRRLSTLPSAASSSATLTPYSSATLTPLKMQPTALQSSKIR